MSLHLRNRPRLASFALSMALAATPALRAVPALAQPAAPGDADASYKQHMTNGVKLYQDKNYEAAIAEFEAAYATKPKASPLVNVALCHKGLFRYPKAIQALERALAKHSDTMTPEDKTGAESAIVELKALLGHVTVKVHPPDATLFVDGDAVPKDALRAPIGLGPGKHLLSARAAGYAPLEQPITVVSGQKSEPVQLTLTPNQGYLIVRAKNPRTTISIDQNVVAAGSWGGFLTPGTHIVQMHAAGGAPLYANQILVVAGKSQEIVEGPGGPIGTLLPPADKKKQDEPPTPAVRGPYAFATAALAGIAGATPTALDRGADSKPGFALGARLGYRFSTVMGLELSFQHGVGAGNGLTTKASEGPNADLYPKGVTYELASTRAGANVRFMTKGKHLRFVGTAGLGLAYDSLTLGRDELADYEGSGATGYALLEPGMELQLGRFMVGLALPIHVTTGQGGQSEEGTTMDDTLAHVGVQARVGYGLW